MKSWHIESQQRSSCPVRIVRDTRVSAFTYAEAIQYLREQNHLYRDLTWEAWTAIQEDPDMELIQAVDEYFMPEAYAEIMQN